METPLIRFRGRTENLVALLVRQVAGPRPRRQAATKNGAREVTVGRAATCDLRIDDDAVSGRHLAIRRAGRDYVAEDLGSTNGTFLGGLDRRITRAILRSGDELRIGR